MGIVDAKTLCYQFTRNGLIYSVAVIPTPNYPLHNLPAALQFKKQFIDIADNHSAFIAEKIDQEHTKAAAAEQIKEYLESAV